MRCKRVLFSPIAFVLAIAFSILVAGCGGSSSAPAPTGTLIGTADDGTNSLDEYVEVTIVPTGGGAPMVIQADTTGAYSASLAEGTYDLTAKRPGYDDFTDTEIAVTASATTTYDFSMNAMAANTYIGSAECGICHATNYATFLNTGHPYKLNKVVGASQQVGA